MPVNFNFGEHFHEGGDSFFSDLTITFLGAFLGFLFALYLNRVYEDRGKQHANKLKRELDIERIRYLGIILNSTVKTAKKQIKHYSTLAMQVKENPLEPQMPIMIASFDVWRLRNLDSIELFDSYSNIFRNIENKTKDYKAIFSVGDYIFERLNDAKKQNERHRNFHHKDELFVRDCVEEIYTRIGLRSKNLKIIYGENATKIQEYNYLHEFDVVYAKVSKGVANFSKLRDEYFKPLHNTILDNIEDVTFADELFTIIKKALGRLQHIEFNAIEFATDMEYLEAETQEQIAKLEQQLTHINNRIDA